jgi:hypothetical protein
MLGGAAALLLFTGLASAEGSTPAPRDPSAALYSESPYPASPTRTPGRVNPAVRQSTIHSTICVAGWTTGVRPPQSYTSRLKLLQMRQYRVTGPPSAYEEDHLIPLELGGAARDPKNLWPEPRPRADAVDKLETSLRRQVCSGTITLVSARTRISRIKHGIG